MRTKLYFDKHAEDWELNRLLGGINLRSTWGKRTYLLITFLCHTGLRIGEMTRLRVSDVAWEGEPREEVFLVHNITKGRKSRTVPFNPVAMDCVRKLLEFNARRGFSTDPQAPLFPWKTHGFLPPREAEREIQKLREKVGLSAKITPHAFRHYFANRLKRAGVDPFTIASILGHSSVDTTQGYTNTTFADRRAAVCSYLPQTKGAA
jgi:site-specific recombinase XerD